MRSHFNRALLGPEDGRRAREGVKTTQEVWGEPGVAVEDKGYKGFKSVLEVGSLLNSCTGGQGPGRSRDSEVTGLGTRGWGQGHRFGGWNHKY